METPNNQTIGCESFEIISGFSVEELAERAAIREKTEVQKPILPFELAQMQVSTDQELMLYIVE